MAKKKESPVIQLLSMVWNNTNTVTGHSYERLNHAMYSALMLAIGSGFRFDVNDFETIESAFRFGYWGGNSNGGFAENFYSAAVVNSNLSAAQAFETWKGRGPIIVDGIDYGYNGSGFKHGGGARSKDRLCVGSRFRWQGEDVEVTSMTCGETKAIACSYDPAAERDHQQHGGRRKPLRRYTITPEVVVADRAERKEREAIIDRATKLPESGTFIARLGVKSRDELDRVPMDKLRRAIEAEEKRQKKNETG